MHFLLQYAQRAAMIHLFQMVRKEPNLQSNKSQSNCCYGNKNNDKGWTNYCLNT